MMAEDTEIPFPHCPHCDGELPAPALFSWQHGTWVILCVFCPECRRTLHLQITPAAIAAAVAAGGEDPSRITIPS
jgi:hypothetical protein